MAGREVVWTDTAAKQRREILNYWKERNKSASYPETKVSAMGHFSIFYRVTDHQIIITAFWDNRQDPEELLAILKKSKH